MDVFVGTIILWSAPRIPKGWRLCDGSLLPIEEHQELFNLIGNLYGGDGHSTFALPDLRGRFPLGSGKAQGRIEHGLGQSGGNEAITLSAAQLPMHTHSASFTPAPLGGNIKSTLLASTKPGNTDQAEHNYLANASSENNANKWNNFISPSEADKSLAPLAGFSLAGSGAGGTVQIGSSGSSQPISITPPYQSIHYIIAIKGTYPNFD